MPERDANQLAADVRAGIAEPHRANNRHEYRKAVAALDELVALVGTRQNGEKHWHDQYLAANAELKEARALVGTLQQEHDEARLDALMAHKAAEIHSDKAVAAEAALAAEQIAHEGARESADHWLAATREANAALTLQRQALTEIANQSIPLPGGAVVPTSAHIARRALANTGGDTKEPA